MSKKNYYLYFVSIFIFSLILSINFSITQTNPKCTWPTDNYTNISSYFGLRIHPITKNYSYHSGIDIVAPEKTTIKSICDGKVIFTGLNGVFGYSIIIQNNNYTILYGHVSPNILVNVGQEIYKSQDIGFVGPKNIEDYIGNKYYDSNR